MKKILLGTSAIVLAGAITSPASAAEWEVVVGGYMNQHVGYANNDLESHTGQFDGIDVKDDGEIHFKPTIVLDNGLKFGARVELESRTGSDQIDENYMVIGGSFGEVRLGEDDAVAFPMQYTAPNVGHVGINSGSDTRWYGGPLLTYLTTTRPAITHDPEGIMYYSPRLAGFQIGASYARDGQKATIQSQFDKDTNGAPQDQWAVGANYVNSFGDFNVALAGVYTTADDSDNNDADWWGVGANLGFAGFTVGGSYASYREDHDYLGFGSDDYEYDVWDLGVSYGTGPWGFSLTYVRADVDDKDGGYKEELDINRYQGAVRYDIAKGVSASAYVIYSDAEYDETGESSVNDDALIIGTSVGLSF